MTSLLKLCRYNVVRNLCNVSQIKFLSSTAETLPQEILDDEESQLYSRVIKKKPRRKPFMKNAFLCEFDSDVLGFPEVLNNEELNELNLRASTVSNYLTSILDRNDIDKSLTSSEVYEQCKNLNLFGLQAPFKVGGQELCETENCRIYEEISKCPSLAISLAHHQYFGLQAITNYATEKAKDKYLSKLISGEYLSAFCLLEESSLNMTMMKTKAESQEDGSMVLNGTKTWVVNGGLANMYVVIAITEKEDSAVTQDKMSILLVDKNSNGISVQKCNPAGLEGTDICNVSFKDTIVPEENVLGKGGDSQQLMSTLLSGIRLSSGPYSITLMRQLILQFAESSLHTMQDKRNISESDIIYEVLAKLNLQLYAMESITYFTAGLLDRYEKHDCELESAIVKVFCSENAVSAIQNCIKLSGLPAFMQEHPFHKLYNQALGNLLINEANDSLKIFIALLGLQHTGMTMHLKVKQLRNPLFYPGFILRRLWERRKQDADDPTLKLGLENFLHPTLIHASRWLEYCVYRLSYATETLLVRHGQQIFEQHMELKRLAEVAILVYTMTAILSRASRSYCIGLRNADSEILLANAYCFSAKDRVKQLVQELTYGPYGTNDANYQNLSEKAFEYKGYFSEHPLTKNF